MTKSYHVFTHNLDEWFSDLGEATQLYKEWAAEFGSARLYEQTYIDDELETEDCLESTGEFPW